MKKIAFMLGEVLLLLGLFMAVAFVHNTMIVPDSGAYGNYLMDNLPIWISIMFAITAAIILIVFQIKKRLVGERYISVWKMSKFAKVSRLDAAMLTLIGIFAALLFMSVIRISTIADAFPDFDDYLNLFMKSDSFVMVIVGVCIVGPLFEEVFFRGVLFNLMRKAVPLGVALLLQAIIYGYAQPNPSIQVTAFFLALMYGVLYTKLQSVWATIWTAFVINTMLFCSQKFGLLELFSTFTDSVLFLMAVLCLFVTIALVVSVWKGRDKVGHLKMVGGLVLWPLIFVVTYFPFLNFWNNRIMSISSISGWLGNNNVIGFVIFDLATFAIFFFAMKAIHKKNLIVVSNFSRIDRKVMIMISILGVGMGVWVQAFFKIPYFHDTFPQFEQLFEYLTTASIPVFILFLFIHSAYKEIFFRALVYNVLRSVQPIAASILVTGIIYGGLFFLWDIPMTIYALAGALIFGLMFEWFRTIWAPIVNELFLFGTYFVMRKLDMPYSSGMVWLLAISSVLVIVMMVVLYRMRESAPADSSTLKQGGHAPAPISLDPAKRKAIAK
ncbi:type II CAAX endopeptidase family protein [Cohnella mopanensis]|uniref:type II CAAX endopeptidase family protein n=1 Tax=Cohnella mopanensis TaxID=2911966 RepID=UPI001EF77B05|nr:CPBP family intramembrane glutamic endopeptidase [Cohnella mopanensis]